MGIKIGHKPLKFPKIKIITKILKNLMDNFRICDIIVIVDSNVNLKNNRRRFQWQKNSYTFSAKVTQV